MSGSGLRGKTGRSSIPPTDRRSTRSALHPDGVDTCRGCGPPTFESVERPDDQAADESREDQQVA